MLQSTRTARRTFASAVVLSLSLGLAAACGSGSTPGTPGGNGSGTLDKMRNEGATIGVLTLPPFSKLTPEGDIVGVDPDVTKAVLKNLGVTKITGVDVGTYANVIPGLSAGRYDMFGGSLGETADKCKAGNVLYGLPILVTPWVTTTLAGKAAPVTSLAEMGTAKLRVGTISGNTLKAEGVYEKNGITDVTEFPDLLAATDALKANRVDTLVAARNSFVGLPDNVKSSLQIGPKLTDAPNYPSSIAFPAGATELQQKFDEALAAFKKTPEFAQILSNYGFDVADLDDIVVPDGCPSDPA